MNVAMGDLSERQLRFGLFKVALSLAALLILGGLVVSFIFQRDSKISSVPIYALLFAVAFSISANGFFTILRIIDWFEKRRALRGATNG